MLARACAVVLAAGVLVVSGCSPKLDVNRTKTIDAADYDLIGLQKLSQPQKVTIEVEAAEPVNILVIDSSAEAGFDGRTPDQQAALAKHGKKLGVKKDSLSVEVPANAAVTVAIGGCAKKTEVKYSISNRK